MRILCRHGHFAIYQTFPGEIARFMEFWGVELVRDGEYYTFPFLKAAPKYALAGKPYLGIAAVKTFAGEPWEILKENGFVYNIALKSLVPKQSISIPYSPELTGYYFLMDGPFMQPGGWVEGNQILSYDSAYDDDEFASAKISEFSYE